MKRYLGRAIRLILKLSTVFLLLAAAGYLYLFVSGKFQYALATTPAMLIVGWFFLKERQFGARTPALLRFLILLQMDMHIYGYVFRLYERIDLWDKYSHFIAGGYIGLAAALVFITHSTRHRIKFRKSTVILLCFLAASGLGNIWEMIEFTIDQLHKFNFIQLSGQVQLQWGNTDTMLDIILNSAGGIISGVAAAAIITFEEYVEHPPKFVLEFLKRRDIG